MKTSRKASVGIAAVLAVTIPLVAGFEGFVNHVYFDAVNVATYCFGETQNPTFGKTYSIEECNALLGSRLAEFDAGVKKCVTVEMPVKVNAAYDSLAYNIGIYGFCRSTVVRRANAGNLRGSCDAILMWNKAGGNVLPGLTRRREAERALCIEGVEGK